MAPETCRTSPISGTLSLYTHLHTPRRPCVAHPAHSHAFPHMHATQACPQLPPSQELALTPPPELYRPLSQTSPAPQVPSGCLLLNSCTGRIPRPGMLRSYAGSRTGSWETLRLQSPDLTVSIAACVQGSQVQLCEWLSLAHRP